MSRRLLIVDDIATNRIVLKVKLAAACYETVQAASGAEALRRARVDRPDLILLDLGLPDMDGLEVLGRLRADPATRDTPVIVISARTGAEARVAALKAGADEILPKPVDDPMLLARVRSLLRARERVREVAQDLRTRDMGKVGGAGTSTDLEETRAITGPEDLADFPIAETIRHSPPAYPGSGHAMAEPAASFDRPGLIALIAPDDAAARAWQDQLATWLPDKMITLNRETALAAAGRGIAPDIYVISANLRATGDGLRLIADLHSRPGSHHAAICIVVPGEDQATAAMALDLGASDLLPADATTAEIALRLRSQMRQKQASDQTRKRVQDQLRLAVKDPLTGLYNRHYAIPRMARIAEGARRSGQAFAVMLLDLDQFKSVNDRHGHVAGDHVLSEVADRLRQELRPRDLLARIGGEEFLVVLPDATRTSARQTAERLCRTIEATAFSLPDGSGALRVTISVGLALENDGPDRCGRPAILAERTTETGASGAGADEHGRRDAPRNRPALTGPGTPNAARHGTGADRGVTCDEADNVPAPATPDATLFDAVPGGTTADTVFQRADRALLCAKARGRNQVTVNAAAP